MTEGRHQHQHQSLTSEHSITNVEGHERAQFLLLTWVVSLWSEFVFLFDFGVKITNSNYPRFSSCALPAVPAFVLMQPQLFHFCAGAITAVWLLLSCHFCPGFSTGATTAVPAFVLVEP